MKRQIIISLVLVIIGGAIGNWFRFAGATPDRGAQLDAIPLSLPGYQGTEQFFDENTYDVLNATTSTLKTYVGANGFQGDVFVAYFESQHFGAGIHSPLVCLPGGGWKIQSEELYPMTFPDGRRANVNRLHIALGNRHSLMYFWYETRNGIVPSEYGLKLDLFRSAISLRPTDAAIVRFTAPVQGGDARAVDQQLLRFIQTMSPSVQQALPF